jgi:hypothetical protein
MVEGNEVVAEEAYIGHRLVHTSQQGSGPVVVRVEPPQTADKAVVENPHGSDLDLPRVDVEANPVGKAPHTGHMLACLGVR